jgi:hypothetical protein
MKTEMQKAKTRNEKKKTRKRWRSNDEGRRQYKKRKKTKRKKRPDHQPSLEGLTAIMLKLERPLASRFTARDMVRP